MEEEREERRRKVEGKNPGEEGETKGEIKSQGKLLQWQRSGDGVKVWCHLPCWLHFIIKFNILTT